MILVIVGMTRAGFSRLISMIDTLAEGNVVRDVYAQIGASSYEPRHCRYARFIPRPDLELLIERADFTICHAGVGSVSMCLAARKKTIVVPRIWQTGETVDGHQEQLAAYLQRTKRSVVAENITQLEAAIRQIGSFQPVFKETTDRKILDVLSKYIEATGLHVAG